jgi:hypothetical protein
VHADRARRVRGARSRRAQLELAFSMKEKLNKYPYHGGNVRKGGSILRLTIRLHNTLTHLGK